MSTFDFSTLIIDRTEADVAAVSELVSKIVAGTATEEEIALFNAAAMKGAYNYTDLNRVTAAMEYLDEALRQYGYVTGYERIKVPHDGVNKLPEGYTAFDFIESSGTQCIDTGYKPNHHSRVVLDFEPVAAYSSIAGIFGARDTASATAELMFVLWNSGANAFRTDYFGTNQTVTVPSLLSRQTVDKNGEATTIGTATVSNTPATGQCGQNLYLFCTNNAGTANYFSKYRLYSCKIYDNGVIVRDYIPCMNTEGEVGLYDAASGQFYANSGTGAFEQGDTIGVSGGPKDDYTWCETDAPTESQLARYLANVFAIYNTTLTDPELPETMAKLDYNGANQIEQALVTVSEAIDRIVAGFARSDCFTFWSGNRPFPCAKSDLGRTWAELDAMNTTWRNWQVASWYLLLYGNLEAEGDVT